MDILELEQKYEDASVLSRYLESEKDQMQDYYLREIEHLKATIVQLECHVEWQDQLIQQVEENKKQQLSKEEDTTRSLLDQMEKLRESMQAEHLEYIRISSEKYEAPREKSEKLRESMQSENLDYIRDSNDKYEALKEMLEEKEEELQLAEDHNRILMVKEFAANQELQDARKELIEGLQEVIRHTHDRLSTIRIKRMGELNGQVFFKACVGKFSREKVEDEATELCSLWKQHLTDPNWHPFKITGNQTPHEVIDEDDQKLKELRNVYGEGVYDAVTKKLLELNQYNPSGRYTIPEVWNLEERRKASMKEVVHYLINELKSEKEVVHDLINELKNEKTRKRKTSEESASRGTMIYPHYGNDADRESSIIIRVIGQRPDNRRDGIHSRRVLYPVVY